MRITIDEKSGVRYVTKPFGLSIKQLRTVKLKETQKEFGARFDVTAQAVSSWENGIYDAPAAVILWVIDSIKEWFGE